MCYEWWTPHVIRKNLTRRDIWVFRYSPTLCVTWLAAQQTLQGWVHISKTGGIKGRSLMHAGLRIDQQVQLIKVSWTCCSSSRSMNSNKFNCTVFWGLQEPQRDLLNLLVISGLHTETKLTTASVLDGICSPGIQLKFCVSSSTLLH